MAVKCFYRNPNWWVDLVQDPLASHLRTQRRILQGFSRYLHFGGCRHGDTSAAALARHLSTLFAGSAPEESFHTQQTRFYNLI